MMAVDTSALMAVLLGEVEADACARMLESKEQLLISAGTMAEALIVAHRRGLGEEMARLLAGLGFEVVNVAVSDAQRIAEAYESWGKGLHPAGLNFGDCFAYAVAKANGCPLLYVGNDFAQTDVQRGLPLTPSGTRG